MSTQESENGLSDYGTNESTLFDNEPTVGKEIMTEETTEESRVISPTIAQIPLSTSNDAIPERTYNGFFTSICYLFRDPQDCCALVCCGALLSDRSYYLLTGGRDEIPSYGQRIWKHFAIPLLLLVPWLLLAGLSGAPDVDNMLILLGVGGICLYVGIDLIKIRNWRIKFRGQILERVRSGPDGTTQLHHEDMQNHFLSHSAHKLCCGCYPVDDLVEPGVTRPQEEETQNFCTVLTRAVSNVCCKMCCGFLMCCGVCALAQEAREVKRMVGRRAAMIDFVTFEPYREFYAKIMALRTSQDGKFSHHFQAMSKLSWVLLKWLMIAFVFMLLVSLFDLEGFNLANLLVLFGTLFQAVFILYFVHWRWNRFDISLDAAVKYFACGFLFVTFLAMIFELLVTSGLGLALNFILTITGIGSPTASQTNGVRSLFSKYGVIRLLEETQGGDDDAARAQLEWLRDNVFLVVLSAFLNAFVVAAVIEELCKYFGYMMVEHPDFMKNVLDEEETSEEPVNLEAQTESDRVENTERNHKTAVSYGAAITIAMVATSMGFAFCENLIYIFVYTGVSVQQEFLVLLGRSLFPVHPICAAIQSIGVCRHDLEGGTPHKIMHILFPAIFLHGMFDFIAMIVPTLMLIYGDKETVDEEPTDDISDLLSQWMFFLLLFALVTCGVAYYWIMARRQRRRLAALDAQDLVDSTRLIID